MINAEVVHDSVFGNSECQDTRITTMRLVMPRLILAQFNKHRVFSSNAQSSRAMPVGAVMTQVVATPFVPDVWGTAQKGMSPGKPLQGVFASAARGYWDNARKAAIEAARGLEDLGVAKELANRLLEPFMYTEVLVTSTEWDNFFNLRLHHTAQREMQELAECMAACLERSKPAKRKEHVPYSPATGSFEDRCIVSAGRCARVSYNGTGKYDEDADRTLGMRLLKDKHMTPWEHQAVFKPGRHANFLNWQSRRNQLE